MKNLYIAYIKPEFVVTFDDDEYVAVLELPPEGFTNTAVRFLFLARGLEAASCLPSGNFATAPATRSSSVDEAGVIAGSVVAGLAVLLLLRYKCKRRRRQSDERAAWPVPPSLAPPVGFRHSPLKGDGNASGRRRSITSDLCRTTL
ncbi:hypothetical protein GGX14DRAFT_406086 [Mycena pura]|uniref:Uncharacterized protein n=1 Tax=Mycena pura TaxID=153505 RepID=A0AAD6XZW3_9AGAR|nr:hypothetical protein GGX14DRAFT_406086 [Mycena pura]